MSETQQINRPDWLPDEYDPDAPLKDRLRVAAGIEGGIELHVADERGVVEIVGQPVDITDSSVFRVYCGQAIDGWQWEIVVPESDDHPARLERVNPQQDAEAYQKTKTTELKDIDARLYGVDDGLLPGAGDVA